MPRVFHTMSHTQNMKPKKFLKTHRGIRHLKYKENHMEQVSAHKRRIQHECLFWKADDQSSSVTVFL